MTSSSFLNGFLDQINDLKNPILWYKTLIYCPLPLSALTWSEKCAENRKLHVNIRNCLLTGEAQFTAAGRRTETRGRPGPTHTQSVGVPVSQETSKQVWTCTLCMKVLCCCWLFMVTYMCLTDTQLWIYIINNCYFRARFVCRCGICTSDRLKVLPCSCSTLCSYLSIWFNLKAKVFFKVVTKLKTTTHALEIKGFTGPVFTVAPHTWCKMSGSCVVMIVLLCVCNLKSEYLWLKSSEPV